MTAKQLADELEIHVRSVYRYIDALCASGVPIVAESGPNGGYALLPTFRESPLFFDAEEQKALVHASRFAKEAGYPYGEALERAVAKLKRYANEEQLASIERHAAGIDVIYGPADESLEDVLRCMETAVADGRTVRIDYRHGYNGTVESRTIDPYGLVFWRQRWYVVAFCRLRGKIRSFRTDRIAAFVVGDERFVRPPDFSARDYFRTFLLPGERGKDELVDVRLRGTRRAIEDICAHWLYGHALVERSESEARFRLEASIVHSYAPYTLLSFGTSIRVVEPDSLVRAVIDALDRLRPHYEAQANARPDRAERTDGGASEQADR